MTSNRGAWEGEGPRKDDEPNRRRPVHVQARPSGHHTSNSDASSYRAGPAHPGRSRPGLNPHDPQVSPPRRHRGLGCLLAAATALVLAASGGRHHLLQHAVRDRGGHGRGRPPAAGRRVGGGGKRRARGGRHGRLPRHGPGQHRAGHLCRPAARPLPRGARRRRGRAAGRVASSRPIPSLRGTTRPTCRRRSLMR